jgi:hypothetical protein
MLQQPNHPPPEAEDDLGFLERRACEESAAAAANESRIVAAAHRLLALEYEAQAKELRARRDAGQPSEGDSEQLEE